MGLLTRRVEYDRTRILDAAGRARARGRRRKAIGLYRRVLAVEPENPELHWKLAPLLAEAGHEFDAWQSFRTAARDLIKCRRVEQALATYREAARHLPHQIEAWQATATLERKLGRSRDAIDTLLEARRAFKRRRMRPQAIAMLRAAREIDEWNPEVVLDLARLLARSDQGHEALGLLEQLAPKTRGRTLRRVRATQWRITRTVGHTWLWLQAAVAAARQQDSSASQPSAEKAPSNVLPLSRTLAR